MKIPKFKILIVGGSGVGKTSILLSYSTGTIPKDPLNTIGVDFINVTVEVNKKFLEFHIWDTAGQERYKAMIKAYFRGAHGSFVVFDVGDLRSRKNAEKWIEDLLNETCGVENKFPIILVGNKIDASTFDEREMRMWAENIGYEIVFVSAKTGFNIDNLFYKMGKLILKKVNEIEEDEEIKFDEGQKCCM